MDIAALTGTHGGALKLLGGEAEMSEGTGGEILVMTGSSASAASGKLTLSSTDGLESGSVYLRSGQAESGMSGDLVLGSGGSAMEAGLHCSSAHDCK